METILIKNIMGEMPKLYAAGVAMTILSRPGIGKTEMIVEKSLEMLKQQVSKEELKSLGLSSVDEMTEEQLGLFLIDMSGVPSESLAIPYIDSSAENHLQRDVIPELKSMKKFIDSHKGDNHRKAIVFIDEITSANQDDQRTLMNFIQSGIVPDGSKVSVDTDVWFILAGNPSTDMPGYEDYDGATNPMEEAVITRGATYFAEPDLESVIEWGEDWSKTAVGVTNLHPYLISALKTAGNSIYMVKAVDDIRLMNSRTLYKLSQYLYATKEIGGDWNSSTVAALIGDNSSSTLCAIIEKLDKLVSLKELFGDDKQKTLNQAAFEKFKDLQDFEKYYILNSAIEESSPIKINANNVRKLMQLLKDGELPQEASSTLSRRIIEAPANSKARKLCSNTYLKDVETNILHYCQTQVNFAGSEAFLQ